MAGKQGRGRRAWGGEALRRLHVRWGRNISRVRGSETEWGLVEGVFHRLCSGPPQTGIPWIGIDSCTTGTYDTKSPTCARPSPPPSPSARRASECVITSTKLPLRSGRERAPFDNPSRPQHRPAPHDPLKRTLSVSMGRTPPLTCPPRHPLAICPRSFTFPSKNHRLLSPYTQCTPNPPVALSPPPPAPPPSPIPPPRKNA